MNEPHRVVLATPHARYDALESELRNRHRYQVLRVREPSALCADALTEFAPSHAFFPHWSWKIPAEIYDTFECIIFHMTDLPFGRGGSPLQNLVLRGIEHTKLTALRCSSSMDAGPVYLKAPLSTLGTAEEVFLRAASLMLGMIRCIVEQDVEPLAQSGEAVTFKRRTPDESDLRDVAHLDKIHDMIRMLDADGYPPAFVRVGHLRLEFTRASRRRDHVMADVRITIDDSES
jgi:methionyl-tRNA formyltransferase